ncbi:unnamed protein product, partial [Rotaria magnacalcarata]
MCVKNSTSSCKFTLKKILGFDSVAYINRKILRGTDQNAAVPRIALPMAK